MAGPMHDPQPRDEKKCVAPPGRECNGDEGIFCACTMAREASAAYRKQHAAREMPEQYPREAREPGITLPVGFYTDRKVAQMVRERYVTEMGQNQILTELMSRDLTGEKTDTIHVAARHWGKTRLQALELTGVDIMGTTRTVDPMRRKSRVMSAAELKRIDRIKRVANKLHGLIEDAEDEQRSGQYGHEYDKARDRLEECVMWATKGISG